MCSACVPISVLFFCIHVSVYVYMYVMYVYCVSVDVCICVCMGIYVRVCGVAQRPRGHMHLLKALVSSEAWVGSHRYPALPSQNSSPHSLFSGITFRQMSCFSHVPLESGQD